MQTIIAAHFFGTSTEQGIHPAAIVAVGTHDGKEIIDWCAYAGGYPSNLDRTQGAALVARNGDKLSSRMASAIFGLPEESYRQ